MNYAQLTKDLIRHEGLRIHPYEDTVGKLTIGIGRNLDDKGISESEARLLLHNDMMEVIRQLDDFWPLWQTLSDERQLVLANMCFQLGIGGLGRFKNMWKAIKERNFELAAVEMLDSKWAKQTPKRASELALRMRKG